MEYEWLLFKDLKVKPNLYQEECEKSLSDMVRFTLKKNLVSKRIDHTFAITHKPLSAPKFLIKHRDSFFVGGQLDDCLELQFQHNGKIGL